jgi:hypothetical protein
MNAFKIARLYLIAVSVLWVLKDKTCLVSCLFPQFSIFSFLVDLFSVLCAFQYPAEPSYSALFYRIVALIF